jgi:hypothetical protein
MREFQRKWIIISVFYDKRVMGPEGKASGPTSATVRKWFTSPRPLSSEKQIIQKIRRGLGQLLDVGERGIWRRRNIFEREIGFDGETRLCSSPEEENVG